MIVENKCENKKEKDTRFNVLLNICMLGFVAVLMIVVMVTFFVTLFNSDTTAAYSIASIYILCMLLVTASLKMFLDKTCLAGLRMANIVGIMLIFASILIITVMVCISFAWPSFLP